jgi:membrane protease YdiL (CAAX protease family)
MKIFLLFLFCLAFFLTGRFLSIENIYTSMLVKGLFALCTIGVIFFLQKPQLSKVRGYSKSFARSFLFLGLMFITVLCYSIYNADFSKLKMLNFWGVSLFIVYVFVTASAEEFLFRLFLPLGFMKSGFDVKKAFLFASVVFALAHLINLSKVSVTSTLNQVMFAFFMGLLLSSVFIITQNLLFACLIHGFVNLPSMIDKVPLVVKGIDISSNDASFSLSGFLLMQLLFLPIYFLCFYIFSTIVKEHLTNSEIESIYTSKDFINKH